MVAVAKEKASGFGARLKAIRIERGLTQAGLGEAAGMPQQAVDRLERAMREPTWPTVLRLADALGVSVAEFRGEIE